MDMAAKVWTVPSARMKAGREHRVPLSGRALAILDEAANGRTGEFVFPGQRSDKPLSGMAMEMLLRRMKAAGVTVHGFRSAFRDWCGEATSFLREIAEAALAHVAGRCDGAGLPAGRCTRKAADAHVNMGSILRTRRARGWGSDETPRELSSTMTERSLEEITVGVGPIGRPRGRPKKLTSSPSKPRPRGRPSLDIRNDPDRHAVVVMRARQSVYDMRERQASLAVDLHIALSGQQI
jgi:hypothetical protein